MRGFINKKIQNYGARVFDKKLAAGMAGSFRGSGLGAASAKATAASEAAMKRAKYGVYGAGVAAVGGSTAMRPNANQSRTSYRGPMQTGRGVGRYA
jgi:hypothetical protein